MNVKSVSRGESEQQGGKLSKTIVPITAKNWVSVDYLTGYWRIFGIPWIVVLDIFGIGVVSICSLWIPPENSKHLFISRPLIPELVC
jgi:hypothetical protein